MWTNNINGKIYIGSSVNLKRRLLEYYNTKRLLLVANMPICTALLKYGYSNFSLTILEFCDTKSLMEREKYYFHLYNPEYNILKEPGSPSRGKGWKHTVDTINKMKLAASNKSPDLLAKLSLSQSSSKKVEVSDIILGKKSVYHAIKAAAKHLDIDKRYIENYIYLKQKDPVFGKYTFKFIDDKVLEKNINIARQKSSQEIEVTEIETNIKTIFPSISAAGKALGLRQPSISLYLKDNRTKPYRGKYLFKLIAKPIVD
jgi:group I intron endonuclease